MISEENLKETYEKRISMLEKALFDAQLKAEVLDIMIDVAEQELHIDIRKKYGDKQGGAANT